MTTRPRVVAWPPSGTRPPASPAPPASNPSPSRPRVAMPPIDASPRPSWAWTCPPSRSSCARRVVGWPPRNPAPP